MSLVELAPVRFVSRATALGGEIELVPPAVLRLRRQRELVALAVVDEITIYRDHGLAALRPERGDDVRRARSPVVSGQDRSFRSSRHPSRRGCREATTAC